MTVSDNARAAHAEVMRVWGSKPKVFRHGDEREQFFINVASLDGAPAEGITAAATLGLSDYDLGFGDVRTELILALPTLHGFGPNIAATCAFNAIKDDCPIHPDAIHANVVPLYYPTTSVPHILMVDPFLWLDGPLTMPLTNMTITWLHLVPIADAERNYCATHGASKLTARFEECQIDIFDLSRESVV